MSAPSGDVAEACGELRDITLKGEEISRTDMPGLATAPGLLVYRATTGPLSEMYRKYAAYQLLA